MNAVLHSYLTYLSVITTFTYTALNATVVTKIRL